MGGISMSISNETIIQQGHANTKKLGLSLEYNLPFFWKLSNLLIDTPISVYVEWKTKRHIRKLLPPEERRKWDSDPRFQKTILDEARKNFGDNRFISVYQIKTLLLGNRQSKIVSHFYQHIGNAPAMDDAYNALGHFSLDNKPLWSACLERAPDLIGRFYFSREHAQAVRNRCRIVQELFVRNAKQGVTLSVACGSGQPIILAFKQLAEQEITGHSAILTDKNEQALERARQLAQRAGAASNIETCNIGLEDLTSAFDDRTFANIEACGIFEYQNDRTVVNTLAWAFSKLEPRGISIISGMQKNSSSHILEKICNWTIIYRAPEHLERLIREAAIQAGIENKISLTYYVEPWGIHHLFLLTRME